MRGELSIAVGELVGSSNDISAQAAGSALSEAGFSPRSVSFPIDLVVLLRDRGEFSSETIVFSRRAVVVPNGDATFATE